ncbi:hypothetical protein [Candidatus Lokiarchaeum ossiferum]|uniref:hypothetical protein n=1 Tax=Candidatus Lokiarchaeum ossiferum TaxID=2951803 RepID=UPI00352DF3D0
MEDYSINAEFKNSESKLIAHTENRHLENFHANFESDSSEITKNNTSISIHQKRKTVKMLSEIQESTFLHHQEPADLNCLVQADNLKDILKTNPWKISITQTLDNFQKHMYSNSEMKFRIGGRIIHSASQIVRAKSNLVIHESHETQDQLLINEVNEDELEDMEDDYCDNDDSNKGLNSLNQILGAFGQNQSLTDDTALLYDDETLRNYILERDSEVNATISTHSYYSVDKNGQRFLASPVRKVFRKIELGDLGKALIKTLNYQLRSPRKASRKMDSKNLASSILNDNLLKKAEEERALVELQISRMNDRIFQLYQNNEPISFLSLIISPDPDGIVRTLLYLLQLVNRKKVELWQKIDDEEKNPDTNIGLDIFVTPRIIKKK